jgi:hypothetical protein
LWGIVDVDIGVHVLATKRDVNGSHLFLSGAESIDGVDAYST